MKYFPRKENDSGVKATAYVQSNNVCLVKFRKYY